MGTAGPGGAGEGDERPIVGTKDSGVNLTSGETIYVRLWAGKEVKAGDRFAILHVAGPIIHPVTGKKVGDKVLISGELVIIEPSGEVLVARISKSNRALYVGDQLVPPFAPIKESLAVRMPFNRIEGVVLSPVEDEENISAKELIFIDRGGRDGVLAGDRFDILLMGNRESSPAEKRNFPWVKIGEAVVFSVQEKASTALVTQSFQSIRAGDAVVTGRK